MATLYFSHKWREIQISLEFWDLETMSAILKFDAIGECCQVYDLDDVGNKEIPPWNTSPQKLALKIIFKLKLKNLADHSILISFPLLPWFVNNHSISRAWTKRFNLSPYFFTHLRNNQTFGDFNFETFIIFIGMKKIIGRNCTRIESRGSLTESRHGMYNA